MKKISTAAAGALAIAGLIVISLVAMTQIGGNSVPIDGETYTLTCNGHRIETTHHYWDEGSYWFRLDDGTYEPVGRGVRCVRE